MKTRLIAGCLTVLAAIPAASFGQAPDGSDVNQAIPIYFGQTVNDIVDSNTRSWQVYSITVSRGQTFSATVKLNAAQQDTSWNICLVSPSTRTIAAIGKQNCRDNLSTTVAHDGFSASALSFSYQVAAAGTYYVIVQTFKPGTNYQLQVTAQGAPIGVPNPAQAGCLTGQVDSITYSLQLIAASLPDEVSIGGTRLCATCTVKPPAYPQLVAKMETAMGLNVGVSACYDAAGNIFQLKLVRP